MTQPYRYFRRQAAGGAKPARGNCVGSVGAVRVGRGPPDRQDGGAPDGTGGASKRSTATAMRDIRAVAAEAQEVPMFPYPDTMTTLTLLHREELLATAARERRAATLVAPALPWRALAIRAVACVAAYLSVRG